MTDEERLLHLISTNLSLPRTKILKVLERMTSKERIASFTAQFKERQSELRKIPLEVSPLQEGGMYNATVDTGSPINIRALLATVQSRGLLKSKDLTVTECKFRYGRFQTALTFSNKYAMVGNASKPIVSANFKAQDSSGRGVSFDFYKTGKVRFSGSLKPEIVRKFFAQYHPVPGTINVNNRVVTFRILGWKPKTSLINDAFSDPSITGKFENMDVRTKFMSKVVKRKTTKLPPSFLYFKFPDFEAILTTTGTVQIQGTTDYESAYRILKRFFVKLKDNDMMIKGATRAPRAKKAPIVNRNVPAPNVTRRGTTCPVDRRPQPYGFGGACTKTGCYVKPNPQGQACCYIAPKKIDYSRDKVQSLYEKAGIQVPISVQKIFGIATKNKAVEVATTKIPDLKIKGDKIDSRQCLRYTKVALVDIARRLRIAMPLKLTKPILCGLIKNYKKMPADLLANIQKGKKLIGVERQLAAVKIQRAFKKALREKRFAKAAELRKLAKAAEAKAAANARAALEKAKRAAEPALIRPIRRKGPAPAPAQAPAAPAPSNNGPRFFPEMRARRLAAMHRANIYKKLNKMYMQGKYANPENFSYLNQAIVEDYYMNANRMNKLQKAVAVERAQLAAVTRKRPTGPIQTLLNIK